MVADKGHNLHIGSLEFASPNQDNLQQCRKNKDAMKPEDQIKTEALKPMGS